MNLISLIRYELLHSLKGVHSTVHVHDGLTSLIAWGGSEHLHWYKSSIIMNINSPTYFKNSRYVLEWTSLCPHLHNYAHIQIVQRLGQPLLHQQNLSTMYKIVSQHKYTQMLRGSEVLWWCMYGSYKVHYYNIAIQVPLYRELEGVPMRREYSSERHLSLGERAYTLQNSLSQSAEITLI